MMPVLLLFILAFLPDTPRQHFINYGWANQNGKVVTSVFVLVEANQYRMNSFEIIVLRDNNSARTGFVLQEFAWRNQATAKVEELRAAEFDGAYRN